MTKIWFVSILMKRMQWLLSIDTEKNTEVTFCPTTQLYYAMTLSQITLFLQLGGTAINLHKDDTLLTDSRSHNRSSTTKHTYIAQLHKDRKRKTEQCKQGTTYTQKDTSTALFTNQDST